MSKMGILYSRHLDELNKGILAVGLSINDVTASKGGVNDLVTTVLNQSTKKHDESKRGSQKLGDVIFGQPLLSLSQSYFTKKLEFSLLI